ncbi:MAG: nodulation S family protein [Actinomycetota bacterium]|nr:nodulation S family protein [Actinomycetota bacterium]
MASEEREPGAAAARQRARAFFSDLWSERDPWDLETSPLDQERYRRQLALLGGRRYGSALELGCGAGAFTRQLAPRCDRILAVDVAESAIERARGLGLPPEHVEFRAADVMDLDLEGGDRWDLVVLTETAYYLGWLYPLFDVAWLAHALCQVTEPGGRLLLVNTLGDDNGIMSPWLVRTYRDLFVNVGYDVETEEVLRGTKETVEFEILLSLFRRPPG